MCRMSAAPDGSKIKLEFNDGAGYGLFDKAFSQKNLLPEFIENDARSFSVRITDPYTDKDEIVARWRTLWPNWKQEWDQDLSEQEVARKLRENGSIQEHELTLYRMGPDWFESEKVMLVTSQVDCSMTTDSKFSPTRISKGERDFRILYAHPRGRVQIHYEYGKGQVKLHSIPVFENIKLIHVEIFILRNMSQQPVLDPGSASDAKRFVAQQRNCVDVWASLGLDWNTFIPDATGGQMSGGGLSYRYRFADPPQDTQIQMTDSERAIPGFDELEPTDDCTGANGELITPWDRLVRYPRAFPPLNPKAIRVFYAKQSARAERLHGHAVGEDPVHSTRGLISNLNIDRRPAKNTVFVYWPYMGPFTLAHEIGHVLGGKKDAGGHFFGGNQHTHLMSPGGVPEDAIIDRNVYNAKKRIYGESNFDWPWIIRNCWRNYS